MQIPRTFLALIAVVLLWSPLPVNADDNTSLLLGPDDPWCLLINRARPGTEIILAAALYTTPCSISVRGEPDAPIIVRSLSDAASDLAVFAYAGSTSNVIDLRGAAHLVLRWLSFAPTQRDVDAIKMHSAHDITILDSIFRGIGGISISANDGDHHDITVSGNRFENVRSTALYFGCHDGRACHATDIVVEANVIDGVEPGDGVGYGVQCKLNSHCIINDNSIFRTRGPGIMVYGSDRGAPPNVVEANFVLGSREEAGINVGGGPAIVRNNVSIGNAYGGIYAQNYGGRDLQRNVWLVHNTVIDNGVAGIITQAWREGRGNVLAFNAIALRSGSAPIWPPTPPGTVQGNITCDDAENPCFVSAEGPRYLPWPALNGPLIGGAGGGPERWRPEDDFMAVARGKDGDAGAFQRTDDSDGPALVDGERRPPRFDPDDEEPAVNVNASKTLEGPAREAAQAPPGSAKASR